MNIDEITIGQVKALNSAFSGGTKIDQPGSMLQNYVGKYVIVRSRNEGINAGYVKAIDETGVVLVKVRRIWYHKPKDKNTCWYEGVSVSGLSKDSKVSCEVEEKVIVEDYSLTLCSEISTISILNHPSHEQD